MIFIIYNSTIINNKVKFSTIFKTTNDNLTVFGKTLLSINKEVENAIINVSKLPITNFDTIGRQIDYYNSTVIDCAEKQQKLRNAIPIDTFQAYTQTLGNNKATLEGYQQYLGQMANGFTGVSKVMANYNAMSSQGIKQQSAYATAISTTNPKLGQYLLNLKGANASMGGYAGSLVTATLKTIGLQAASIALNATLTMGLSFAIQGLISYPIN